ncbi:MAG: chemotaxis protein CheD [Lachnospiraceae bacterium]|nr:chemotaxis protein CheD [Lachnospiraceae bacterium]
MSEVIRVGMADYKICRAPQKITTLGLGSCLGVVLYDKTTRICGMAHAMLPDSSKVLRNDNRCKFVDTCLEDMYEALLNKKVNPRNLTAKIAGGAKMFSHNSKNEFLNIGEQNVMAVRKQLKKWDIPIVAEDVGLTYGRTIIFDPETAELLIRAVGIGDSII